MKHYCSIICEGDTPEIVYNKNENSADASTQQSNTNNFTEESLAKLTNICNKLAEKLKQTLKFSKDGKTNELITNLKVTYDYTKVTKINTELLTTTQNTDNLYLCGDGTCMGTSRYITFKYIGDTI